MKYLMIVITVILFAIFLPFGFTFSKQMNKEPKHNNVKVLKNKVEKSREGKRGYKVSSSFLEYERKRAHFKDLLTAWQPRFKVINKSLKEALDELSESTGLKFKLVLAGAPGYLYDDQYELKKKSFLLNQKVSLNVEYISREEIIRYLTSMANLNYKADYQNQIVLIAEPAIIFDNEIIDFKIKLNDFDHIMNQVFSSKYIHSSESHAADKLEVAFRAMGVKFPSGIGIKYENDEFILPLPKSQKKLVVDILNQVHSSPNELDLPLIEPSFLPLSSDKL